MRTMPGIAAKRTITAVLLSALVGCVDYLEPGELGELRYFGEVRGEVPLRLFPPIADRLGNVYVLWGTNSVAEVAAFVGHASGGWSSGCEIHKGNSRGVHGFVGRAFDRAWYWSGDSLVEVSGTTGGCSPVLDRDPSSAVDLRFRAVVPSVRETPSRTTVPALIQSVADPLPFHVLVDLDTNRYTNLAPFEPGDAANVRVVGVGPNGVGDGGFMIVQYGRGNELQTEALYLSSQGRVTHRVPVVGIADTPEDELVGYLHTVDGSNVAGLLRNGDLVAFSRSGGGRQPVTGFTAVGVHLWRDQLWLVGDGDGQPVVARLDTAGSVGTPVVWRASERVSASLNAGVIVIDERTDPRRRVRWQDPRAGSSVLPFVQPFSPHRYARGTTAWLVAGPAYTVGVGERWTAVAFAPVGLDYP